MTDRGILFSTPMVRAILAGTKTQTRRIVKLKDHKLPLAMGYWCDGADGAGKCVDPNGPVWSFGRRVPGDPHNMYVHERVGCPYGQPGDRLWVREEHHLSGFAQEIDGRAVADADDVDEPEIGCHYHADGAYRVVRLSKREGRLLAARKADRGRKMLGRFLYKSCARVWLEITGVRVERLQEISEGDAYAEGVTTGAYSGGDNRDGRRAFIMLWESINGPGSWAANPWVWCLNFRMVVK